MPNKLICKARNQPDLETATSTSTIKAGRSFPRRLISILNNSSLQLLTRRTRRDKWDRTSTAICLNALTKLIEMPKDVPPLGTGTIQEKRTKRMRRKRRNMRSKGASLSMRTCSSKIRVRESFQVRKKVSSKPTSNSLTKTKYLNSKCKASINHSLLSLLLSAKGHLITQKSLNHSPSPRLTRSSLTRLMSARLKNSPNMHHSVTI